MGSQIHLCVEILRRFLAHRREGLPAPVDRDLVVAHATLSALLHHWPSVAKADWRSLLDGTAAIRAQEGSRWLTQRRIAVARLARELPIARQAD